MTRPSIDVIVPVWRHGREVVPTLRSLLDIAREVEDVLELRVVIAASGDSGRRLPDFDAEVVTSLTFDRTGPNGLFAAAVQRSGADHIALLEAGDLVDGGFLRAVPAMPEGSALRPATVVSFGRRTGTWTQPAWRPGAVDSPHVARALARRTVWAPTLAAHRETLVETLGAGPVSEEPVALAAALLEAGVPQVPVKGTVTFVRRWTANDPHLHVLPALEPMPLLADRNLALGADAPATSWTAALPGPAARLVRIGGRLAQPWRDMFATARRRGRQGSRFDAALIDRWLWANRFDPLVPYPRPDIGGWVEDWDAGHLAVDRETQAYWWLRSRMPARVDYLLFAPWLRTGGGDTVVVRYIDSILRHDPCASVVLVTTEPVESTRLGDLDSRVTAVELREVLERGVSRDALVEWIVPQLVAQLHPGTVHAVNSTVAFDVIERFGDVMAERSALFLSTFAIDRSSDGERLSVMFLRDPGFLDPVSAVLVDSERYARTVVDELGYSREKFVVQRNAVEVTRRPRRTPAGVGRDVPLRVFWAGRFDLPKRLDILARIAEACHSSGLPVDIHFFGLEVMGDPTLSATLLTLEESGATRHPPYAHFGSLALDDFDAYLLTSEWEGVPLSVLEAMSAGVPVIAPLVGGVGEVLDSETGYPIPAFDDVDAYLDAFRAIIDDEQEALARAERACRRMEAEFSQASFDDALRRVPGYLY